MKKKPPVRFQKFVKLIEQDVPIKIKYKDENSFMKFLNTFMKYIAPTFMTTFTTTIGNTVYFPSRDYVIREENLALRILAHEAIHLLDAKRLTGVLFSLSYLFPQILALGFLSFPLLGLWSLLFLLFLLPIPSPTRFYLETRGYSMNVITHHNPSFIIDSYVKYFTSWEYYKMYPFEKKVKKKIEKWMQKMEKGEDKILTKVLLWYETVKENK